MARESDSTINVDDYPWLKFLWSSSAPLVVAQKCDTCHRSFTPSEFTRHWMPEEWQALLDRYGNKCLCCGSTELLLADHVIPMVRGSAHAISNIQPLCNRCNYRKGVKIIDYRPVLTPVLVQ